MSTSHFVRTPVRDPSKHRAAIWALRSCVAWACPAHENFGSQTAGWLEKAKDVSLRTPPVLARTSEAWVHFSEANSSFAGNGQSQPPQVLEGRTNSHLKPHSLPECRTLNSKSKKTTVVSSSKGICPDGAGRDERGFGTYAAEKLL